MKNTNDLRNFIAEQMVKVAEGKQGVKEAKAICNYSQQIYNTVNIELKTEMAKKRYTGFELKPINFPKQ